MHELGALVQDVTRTFSMVLRPFGVNFPQATDEEAVAIAAPGSRMLAKWPRVQKAIRRVSDPIVLTGAVVALFAARRIVIARSSAPVTIAPVPPQAPRVAAATPAPGPGAPIAPPSPAFMSATSRDVANLYDSILGTIATAGNGL